MGFWELALLLIVILIVVNPKRIPVLARQFGRLWGLLQRHWRGAKADLQRQIDHSKPNKAATHEQTKDEKVSTKQSPKRPS